MATTLLVIIVAEQLPRALYCVKQRSTCSSSGQVVQPQLSLQEEQQPAERANLAPADASCQPGVWPACPEPDIEQGLQAAAPDGAAALCSSHTFSGHNTSNALHCYSCSSSSSSLTSSNSTQNDAQQHRATDDGQLVTALAPDAHSGDCTVCVCDTSIVLELPDNSKGVVDGRAQHPSQQTYHSPDRGGQRGQLGHRSHRAAWFARAWGGGNHWSPAFGDIKAEHSSDTLQLLLSDSSVCATDGESQSACCSQSSSLLSSSSSSTHGGGGDGSLQPESSMQEHNSGSSSILSGRGAQAWLQVLAVGSIAGTLSGIMEGLTGEAHTLPQLHALWDCTAIPQIAGVYGMQHSGCAWPKRKYLSVGHLLAAPVMGHAASWHHANRMMRCQSLSTGLSYPLASASSAQITVNMTNIALC